MENIATAIAGPSERNVALGIGVVLLLGFAASVPFLPLPLPEVPSFIPAVFSAASLAQILTAMLFFVQWRITGQAQLALLALAFAVAAVTGSAWGLAYPGAFSPRGLLGGHPLTLGWLFAVEQSTFGAIIIAFALLDRYPRRISRSTMRIVAAAVLAVVIAATAACIVWGDRLPPTTIGRAYTPLFTRVLVPFLLGEYVVVLAVVASTGIRTVAHVWLFVVCACKLLEILTTSLAAGRFSVGWYAGRFSHLISASLLLYVFFVKINDLLVRLASRNRSLTQRTEIDALAIAQSEQRYRLLTNALPQLVWTTDSNGALDYVNDRWITFTGLDLARSQQTGWLRAVHPDDRAALGQHWAAALRSGHPLSLEYRMGDGATARYRWFLLNALAIPDVSGEAVRWIATSTDIDVAKRVEERESYLAAASDRLSASIDMATTLATVEDLTVPRLCDVCEIDLIDDDGRFYPAAIAGFDGIDDSVRGGIGRRADNALQQVLEGIVAGGEPVVIREPDALADTLPDLAAVNPKATAAIIVPLLSGESAIGTLALVSANDRPISADDIGFARDFARRAALALDHARLYERERATADALQRAMLPAQLPQLDHVTFSASYSAASESQRVGGDFYDAFALPDGRVALTIGDVTGHGLEAAVIMGEIRQALRAAAFERAEPSAILDRASRLLIASGRTVFVTAIFGVLDPLTGRLAYATAGHPPPLLYDGGAVIRLPSSGLPLGLREDDGVDFALSLHAPCTLTLYTDGLLEFARDLDEGERRIEAAIRALAGGANENLAGAIMQHVLGDDEATDDIAILTATVDCFPLELPGEEREWRFLSTDAGAAALARHEIGALVAVHWPHERFFAELVFGELIANAVQHAPGPVVARCKIAADGTASIELDDTGSGFTPPAASADILAETGRGLLLLRELTDGVDIGTAPGGGASVIVRLRGGRR